MTENLNEQIKNLTAERNAKSAEIKRLKHRAKWLEKNSANIDSAVLTRMINDNDQVREWAVRLRDQVASDMYSEYVAASNRGTDSPSEGGA